MLIRPFTDADQQQVIALWHECGLVVPWNDPAKDIARKQQVNPELFLVAEDNGAIVGSLMGGYEGHRGWMNYLAVAPSQRSNGLGRELVTRIEQLLIARGCPKINLQVRSTNTAVIDYYRSLGYQEDHAIGMGKRLIADN